MSDEQSKKVTSVPPPTEEIDQEWSASEAGSKPKATAASPHEDEEEEYEDEEDEEEGEDEEDDVHAAAHARTAANAGVTTGTAAWLPDWAPYAVLGGLVTLGLVGGLGGLVKPDPARLEARVVGHEPPSPAARQAPAPTPAAPAVAETVEASHLLVAYQGAMRASPTITRSKEEAQKRAQEAQLKAKKGGNFAELVAEYSDEPGAGARGGKLGSFTRERMVKPFADAAFALKPGELSSVVETAFGFHVILRTK